MKVDAFTVMPNQGRAILNNNIQQTILIVDDSAENIDILDAILRPHYLVRVATNGERALEIAQSRQPDIILLDIMMPGIDGYEVCRRLKEDPKTSSIPVIFITTKGDVEDEKKGFESGAADYITKPISPPIVEARIRTHLALYDQNRELAKKVKERTYELEQSRLEIIHRLGRAVEFKDYETGLHVIRISHYARLLSEALGMNQEWSELLFNAAPLHDIGKIGIPDRTLQKPGPLSEDEWKIMKKHPEYGAAIIGEHVSELLQMAQQIALTHHEKWDGSGYPRGLQGLDIPLVGRIIAVVDVFDALTTVRPYKKALSVDEAVQIIKNGAGCHFDPDLVTVFEKILPEIIEIKTRYDEKTGFHLEGED